MAFRIPSGLLALHKPPGISSNAAVQIVKKTLNTPPPVDGVTQKYKPRKKGAIKVGHGGTLDPLAEGVLVLGVGDGTRALTSYLSGSKAYIATGVLGTSTDTLDSTGKVASTRPWQHVTHSMLSRLLAEKYVGSFHQIPPMFSALKKDGVALYDMARQGIELEREPRQGAK